MLPPHCYEPVNTHSIDIVAERAQHVAKYDLGNSVIMFESEICSEKSLAKQGPPNHVPRTELTVLQQVQELV